MPNAELTIDCGEILLREFRVLDAEAIAEISNMPEVSAFLPDWKASKKQRLHWLKEYEVPANAEFLKAVPTVSGHMLKLAIVHKESGNLIGWCCSGIKDELPEPNREIMYAVSPTYQKRGYATRAAKGLIAYLFANTDVELLNAIARIENSSSITVIEKSGFTPIGEIDIEGQRYKHYTIQK